MDEMTQTQGNLCPQSEETLGPKDAVGLRGIGVEAVRAYLREQHGTGVRINDIRQIGGAATGDDALKQFGYGSPVLVDFTSGRERKRFVFRRVKRNAFGRERSDDRLAALWLDYRTFNDLPNHVPAIDLLLHTCGGNLQSIADGDEAVLVTEFRNGERYADDLKRVRDEGHKGPEELHRIEILAGYLAHIHLQQHYDPYLWRRRLRDLVGHGEGIMGLTESYPTDASFVEPEQLIAIEEQANRWRWRLKPRYHRLCQVHGDFHPFNVLFDKQNNLTVLDRSRGRWGEAADDVSSMAMNYIFFGLQQTGTSALATPFDEMHDHFWARYLELRPDLEIARLVQPWLAWRALVLASPQWYPDIPDALRTTLITFAQNVLASEEYDYAHPEAYLEGAS